MVLCVEIEMSGKSIPLRISVIKTTPIRLCYYANAHDGANTIG